MNQAAGFPIELLAVCSLLLEFKFCQTRKVTRYGMWGAGGMAGLFVCQKVSHVALVSTDSLPCGPRGGAGGARRVGLFLRLCL